MTREKTYLKEFYSNSYVTFGDGSKGIRIMVGHGIPCLNDVLLVGCLTTNLISISQLCDQGLIVTFGKYDCIITNKYQQDLMKDLRSKDNCYMWIS